MQEHVHDYPEDREKEMEATIVHEVSHGLCEYKLQDYWKALDYWSNEDTKSGKDDAEEPVTEYGRENASEDLCEAVRYYFMKPDELEVFAPERFDLVDKMVKEWKNGNVS